MKHCIEMLQVILLLLPGVVSAEWKVNYPPPICTARGSNATIDCNFTYPQGQQVQQLLWCSMRSNHGNCHDKPYVYDSEASNNQNNFQHIGNKASDCSLLISNINQTHSGEYRFRFITSKNRWTGNPGVNILVHDLRVSMSRSRENGSTIAGDSLNLTCTLKCPGDLAEVQWFKNGDPIQRLDPVLTFNRVTAKDSGNYSCSLRNFKTTVSEEFTIYIEDVAGSPAVLIIVIVVSLFALVFITAAVMLIGRRKAKTHRKPVEEREEAQDSLYSNLQTTAYTNLPEAKDVQQEDEVEYSSVSIKPKELLRMSANTEQQDDSTIYSTVMNG